METKVPEAGAKRESAPVVHYDLDTPDLRTACGEDLTDLSGDTYSTDPAAVDCAPCAATLVDGQLGEPGPRMVVVASPAPNLPPQLAEVKADKGGTTVEVIYIESRTWANVARKRITDVGPCRLKVGGTEVHNAHSWYGNFEAGKGSQYWWCLGVEAPVATERRTVGLEVLTDELRAASSDVVWGGRVGIVCRIGDEVVGIPELDTLWEAPYRKPADVLAILLRQARMYADGGIQGDGGAELLMPGADVLAALSGRPVGRYTAPLKVRAEQVDVGWIVSLTDTDAVDLVAAVVECEDETCSWNQVGACTVIVAHGVEPVHFSDFHELVARIPAGEL